MIIPFLLLLVFTLGFLVVTYRRHNRNLQQTIKEQERQITSTQQLLRTTIFNHENEQQKISECLQSVVSSKIHAINLVLHSIDKKAANDKNSALTTISQATQSSLSTIHDLVSHITSSTLNEMGLVAALNELTDYSPIQVAIIASTNSSPATSEERQIYRMIAQWLNKSEAYQAQSVTIEWKNTAAEWQLSYKDDARYSGISTIPNQELSIHLSVINAQVERWHINHKGKTILLKGVYWIKP